MSRSPLWLRTAFATIAILALSLQTCPAAQLQEAKAIQPCSVLAACRAVVEQEKEALAWTETWEAWHHFTITAYGGTPILDILVSYLKQEPGPWLSVDNLRLNEWMCLWDIYNRMSLTWQQAVQEGQLEWLQKEERLHQGFISSYPAALHLLAEKSKQFPVFKERLFSWIEATKRDPSREKVLAAANAMTILNKAGFSFSGRDFRGIQVAWKIGKELWQGPDLGGSMLSGADLGGANLRGSRLGGSCLIKANLEEALLDQVNWQDIPAPHGVNILFCTAPRGHGQPVTHALFSPDGRTVVSAAKDERICVWDVETGGRLRVLDGHEGRITQMQFSPDGTLLASASADKTIRLWDPGSALCLATLAGHIDQVNQLTFFPAESSLLASGSDDGTVRIWKWEAEKGECTSCQVLQAHTTPIRGLSVSRTGMQLASAAGRTLRLWQWQALAKQGEENKEKQEAGFMLRHTVERDNMVDIRSVQFSPDSTMLAVGSAPGLLFIFDPWRGRCAHHFSQGGRIEEVRFSPDSRLLVSRASQDSALRLWEPRKGNLLQFLKGHTDLVWSICFSPDSTRLASTSKDKTTRIWDTKRGTCLHLLQGNGGMVWAGSFSPDGRHFVSASHDQTLLVWNIEARRQGATSYVEQRMAAEPVLQANRLRIPMEKLPPMVKRELQEGGAIDTAALP